MKYICNETELKSSAKEANRKLQKQVKKVSQKGIVQFAKTAVKYLPPKKREGESFPITNFNKQFYKRQVINLDEEIEQKSDKTKIVKMDKIKKTKGYLFKVLMKKGDKKFEPKFFKTERQANHYKRIYNRGLMRFAMGAKIMQQFTQQGNELISSAVDSVIFKRLQAKSPNLSKHVDKNIVKDQSSNDEIKYHVENQVIDTEHFRGGAIGNGEKRYALTVRKIYNKIQKGEKIEI